MNYQLVTTLGPSTRSTDEWLALLEAGASAFRINTSHVTTEETDHLIRGIGEIRDQRGLSVPVVLDLQGSKWRLGTCAEATLETGSRVRLVHGWTSESPLLLPVPHDDFFRAVEESSGEIVLNDARVRLHAESVSSTEVVARVTHGGPVSTAKGVTLPGCAYRIEKLSDKDREIAARTHGNPAIRYAVSYVKDSAEMERYRNLLPAPAYLIAKIERRSAVEDVQAVAGFCDELWVCRGDLGAELGGAEMARTVHGLAAYVRTSTLPVLMAGQVLEHMTGAPTPTRAELCNLYDVLSAGYSGVVLSDETAIGRYPAESCRTAAMFREPAGNCP
jgi:pyruvate kinase